MWRRSPIDELFVVFRDFDNLFRRNFGDITPTRTEAGRLPGAAASGETAMAPDPGTVSPALTRWSFTPAVESYVKDGKLFVRAELPGVEPEGVQVIVNADRLTISGEKKASREMSDDEVYHREIALGRFERSFRLPQGVKNDDIKARYENGVLELSMPVPGEAEPKKVQIEVAPGGSKHPKAA